MTSSRILTNDTHYLASPEAGGWERGLCGAHDPILDLGPVKGRITCKTCNRLWDAGYSLATTPPSFFMRLRARLNLLKASEHGTT